MSDTVSRFIPRTVVFAVPVGGDIPTGRGTSFPGGTRQACLSIPGSHTGARISVCLKKLRAPTIPPRFTSLTEELRVNCGPGQPIPSTRQSRRGPGRSDIHIRIRLRRYLRIERILQLRNRRDLLPNQRVGQRRPQWLRHRHSHRRGSRRRHMQRLCQTLMAIGTAWQSR